MNTQTFILAILLAIGAGSTIAAVFRAVRHVWRKTLGRKPCPRCGSRSRKNWHPESQACADCGYGVSFPREPIPGIPVQPSAAPSNEELLRLFFGWHLTEEGFAGFALAGGMTVRDISTAIEDRRQRQADLEIELDEEGEGEY